MNQRLHAMPAKAKSAFYFRLILLLLSLVSVKGFSQFTAGNLVVEQVGDGTGALSSTSTPLFLKEFTPAGVAGITVTIPATGASALTTSGSATSEGLITRSSDGLSIIIPGYNTASGFASVANSSTTTTPGPVLRAIGKINTSGTYSLAATTTSFSANNERGATSDGSHYWGDGANTGIVLESSGAGTVVSSTQTNTRSLAIYNGNLYFSTGSGTQGIYQVGSGLPTSSGNTSTLLFATQSSPYQFAINAAGNVAYVADDSKGIYKYTLSGTTWTGVVLSSTPARGLIVDFSGTNPIVYATTTATTANSIIKIIDNGSATTSTVATAAANTVFRGIAFSPAAAVTTYTIAATQSANGSITPTGTTTVNSGSSQAYSITPNTGYHVATLTVDGASVTPATTYTFSNVTANHTITATFAINTFTITATQSANGSITPTGATTVNYGGSQAYSITPTTGYSVATLTVDGASVTPATTYTFSNVTASHTITATFAINTFTITATQSANGSITPTGATTVNYGGSQAYSITPTTGYSVATLTVDGASVTPATTYTFSNVTANHTITATFAINTFTITATQSANGSITPTGATTVNYGGSQAYSITPTTGYSVATLTVDGASVTPATTYTFSNVTANHTITATFAINTFTITATQSANGSITPTGATTVNYGGSQAYSIIPNTGYSVATLTVDGAAVTPATSYTFTNVTANHTITATFAINTFTISSSAGDNGSISPNGTTIVNYGGSQTYTITPNTCYSVILTVDGSVVTPTTSYTFSNVTSNHTISATFVASAISINSGQKNPNCDSAGNPNYGYGSFDLQGVGGTGPYTYAFNQGGTINTPYGSQQYYNNIPANTNYTLSVKDATGCVATKTKQITKLNGSLSVSGSDPSLTTAQICYGKMLAIFPSGHPGILPYTYSTDSGATYSATRPIYEPAGTYKVKVKDGLGCIITTNAVTITQPSAPLAFSTKIQNGVCNAGRTVTVTATGGYGSYKYLLAAGAPNYSGTPTSGGSSYTFTNVTPGTYTVTVADVHGCSTSNVIHVTDDATVPKIVVITNSNTVTTGSTVTYAVSPVAGASYTWSVPAGDQVVSGQGTATVQINWVTSGPLKLTASASCTTSTSQWEEYVTVTNGGGNPAIASTLHQSGISVFPNPASDNATVVYSTAAEGKYTLVVTDVTGRVLARRDAISNKGDNIIKLNVGNYANGLYFIRLSDGTYTQSIKLIKAK